MAVFRSGLFWIAWLLTLPGVVAVVMWLCFGLSGGGDDYSRGFPFRYYHWSDFGGSWPCSSWAFPADCAVCVLGSIAASVAAAAFLCKKKWMPRRISLAGALLAALTLSLFLKWNLDRRTLVEGALYGYGAPLPVRYIVEDGPEESGWDVQALLVNVLIAEIACFGIAALHDKVLLRRGEARSKKVANGS